MIGWLVTAATVASGVVSFIVIISVVIDALTRGWIRGLARSWLGINEIRESLHTNQIFLLDMGRSYNDLKEQVCDEHDIPEGDRPDHVDVEKYNYYVEGEDGVTEGDFLRGGDD